MNVTQKKKERAEQKRRWTKNVALALRKLKETWTFDQIALTIGLSYDVVRKYAKGERVPKYATLVLMQDFYKVKILRKGETPV